MSVDLRSASISASGPLVLLHGGAWDIPDSEVKAHRDGLRTALTSGRAALDDGEIPVDLVAAVVTALEAHEAFNAGYGAMLNRDGEAELDAGIMQGRTHEYGAVLATRHLAHPVQVARRLLRESEGRARMLAGEGAERFAEAQGIDLVPNERLVCPREQKRYEQIKARTEPDHPSRSFLPDVSNLAGGDTVGAVVRDSSGQLAAATSTGGTPFKPPGRIGDAPLPGAGFYADDRVAVSSTGWGEAIAAVGLARSVREHVVDGAVAEAAARTALTTMHERVRTPDGEGATGGCIVVTPDDAAYAFTTPRMARGWHAEEGSDWAV